MTTLPDFFGSDVLKQEGSPNRLLHSLFGPTQPASTGQNVPRDYDGDGRADFAVKTDDGRWRIDYASNGFGAFDQTIILQ